jgi:hypothetical protein
MKDKIDAKAEEVRKKKEQMEEEQNRMRLQLEEISRKEQMREKLIEDERVFREEKRSEMAKMEVLMKKEEVKGAETIERQKEQMELLKQKEREELIRQKEGEIKAMVEREREVMMQKREEELKRKMEAEKAALKRGADQRKSYADIIALVNKKKEEEMNRLSLQLKLQEEDKKIKKELALMDKLKQRELSALKREEEERLKEANIRMQEEIKKQRELQLNTDRLKVKVDEDTKLAAIEEQKRKILEEAEHRRKLKSDSVEMVNLKIQKTISVIQDEIKAKDNVSGILESEITSLKRVEFNLLQSYVKKNSEVRAKMMEANRNLGVEKLKVRAEGYLKEKQALEIKLDAKKNYGERLEKELKLNELKQQLKVLNERMRFADTVNVNKEELVKSLKIQQEQIIRSIEAVENEVLEIEEEIKEKLRLYNQDMQMAREQEKKLNLQKEEEKKAKTGNIDQKISDLENYRLALADAKTGAERLAILKKIDEVQKSYPDGVYEEIITENNRTIKRYVVSKNEVVDIFKMVIYSWGGTFYFKNGNSITKNEFDKETKY